MDCSAIDKCEDVIKIIPNKALYSSSFIDYNRKKITLHNRQRDKYEILIFLHMSYNSYFLYFNYA